jgi:hypothetical protein
MKRELFWKRTRTRLHGVTYQKVPTIVRPSYCSELVSSNIQFELHDWPKMTPQVSDVANFCTVIARVGGGGSENRVLRRFLPQEED